MKTRIERYSLEKKHSANGLKDRRWKGNFLKSMERKSFLKNFKRKWQIQRWVKII